MDETKQKTNSSRVSLKQRLRLLEVMQMHSSVAMGLPDKRGGKSGCHADIWEYISNQLNMLEGPSKTSNQWRKSWIDWKSNVKKCYVSKHKSKVLVRKNRVKMSAEDKEVLKFLSNDMVEEFEIAVNDCEATTQEVAKSTQSITDFTRICRTCLYKTEEKEQAGSNHDIAKINWQLRSIYECEDSSLQIVELLNDLVPQLHITTIDTTVPQMICERCLEQIRQAHQFQQMCLSANSHMQQLLQVYYDALEDKSICSTSEQDEHVVELLVEDPLEAAEQEAAHYLKLEECDWEVVQEKVVSENTEANLSDYVQLDIPLNQNVTEKNSDEITSRLCKRPRRQKQTEVANEGIEMERRHVCKYCNKAFKQSGTLTNHLRIHTGEKPYLCSDCGKSFNSWSNMSTHLARHSGERRHECPDCPKKFPCHTDLASHMAVHWKLKPYVCDICNAAFGTAYQVKLHKMYHNDERPYKCEYCEKRFVTATYKRDHMRWHTDEKPFKCKYCESNFKQRKLLMTHLRSHLGDNVYQCELCPLRFRLSTQCREHFATHKGEDEETRLENLQLLKDEEAALIKLHKKVA